MRRTGPLVMLAMVCITSIARAQRAVATTGLNVRSGQSTASHVVGHIAKGDTVTLVSSDTVSDYLHVRTAAGVKGWAWSKRLTVVAGGTATSTSTVTSPVVDPAWTKTPTNALDYHWLDGDHKLCEAGGETGDAETNTWKNRTDSATEYHAVTWQAIAGLDFPHNKKKHRNEWTAGEKAALAKYEGTPVSVVAFVSGIKVELPGKKNGVQEKGESTNCGELIPSRVDWHMYVTASPKEQHYLAVVAETTPRVRPAHPGWSSTKIEHFASGGDQQAGECGCVSLVTNVVSAPGPRDS